MFIKDKVGMQLSASFQSSPMDTTTHSGAQVPPVSSNTSTESPSSNDPRFVGSKDFTVDEGIFDRTRRNDSTTPLASSSATSPPWSGGAIVARSRDFRVVGGTFSSKTKNFGPVPPTPAPTSSQGVIFLDSQEFIVSGGTFNILTENYAIGHRLHVFRWLDPEYL
ncbi:hypothetical protein C8R44DRAFT_740188 [Mycena epipterygia]|nr:hypothetical protein C8R44DRAFT_740188 [Mycena epipterygia]